MNTHDKNTQAVSNLEDTEQTPTNTQESNTVEGRGALQAKEDALQAKEEELKALNDKYLRLAAEFENYKRLTQRDQREQAKFANETLLKELLPVVDNLQRALQFANVDTKTNGLARGVELTLKQFLETLNRFGVKPIKSIGEPFDPSRHQAVASTESADSPAHTVVQEHQPGYLLHDRILRAAMVTVAAPTGTSQSSPDTQEGEHHG